MCTSAHLWLSLTSGCVNGACPLTMLMIPLGTTGKMSNELLEWGWTVAPHEASAPDGE